MLKTDAVIVMLVAWRFRRPARPPSAPSRTKYDHLRRRDLPWRLMRECIHYVDLAPTRPPTTGMPLPTLKKTIAENYDSAAVPARWWSRSSTTWIAPARRNGFTDANLCSSSPHPDQPSRLMTLSGKTFA